MDEMTARRLAVFAGSESITQGHAVTRLLDFRETSHKGGLLSALDEAGQTGKEPAMNKE